PAADGSGNLWTRAYVDGLGRAWRTVSKGPSTSQNVYSDSTFDQRGNLSTQTRPYYWSGSGNMPTTYVTTHNYDALNQPTKLTRPDGKYTTIVHGILYNASDADFSPEAKFITTTTDELGHQSRDATDAIGHAVLHSEWKAGVEKRTKYHY